MIDSLCKEWGQLPESIVNMPYAFVMDMLVAVKEHEEYRARRNDIKRQFEG